MDAVDDTSGSKSDGRNEPCEIQASCLKRDALGYLWLKTLPPIGYDFGVRYWVGNNRSGGHRRNVLPTVQAPKFFAMCGSPRIDGCLLVGMAMRSRSTAVQSGRSVRATQACVLRRKKNLRASMRFMLGEVTAPLSFFAMPMSSTNRTPPALICWNEVSYNRSDLKNTSCDSCSICVYLFNIHLTGGTNDIDQVQHETLTYILQLAKVDDVMDCMPHLMSDTGDNMLVFRHVCSLLFSFSSMGILLSSALSGPPMPKTKLSTNKAR